MKYHGKIYKLVCDDTDLIYYGSTTKPLNKRLNQHKFDKTTTARHLFDKGNVRIQLIEEFPCDEIEQLEERERYYIKRDFHKIVNKYVPARTDEEKREIKEKYWKQYALNNKERIREYKKREYRLNIDYYRTKNKLRSNQSYNCEYCKCSGRLQNKSRHEKSKTHINNMITSIIYK